MTESPTSPSLTTSPSHRHRDGISGNVLARAQTYQFDVVSRSEYTAPGKNVYASQCLSDDPINLPRPQPPTILLFFMLPPYISFHPPQYIDHTNGWTTAHMWPRICVWFGVYWAFWKCQWDFPAMCLIVSVVVPQLFPFYLFLSLRIVLKNCGLTLSFWLCSFFLHPTTLPPTVVPPTRPSLHSTVSHHPMPVTRLPSEIICARDLKPIL